jgi:tetrahydromethanopterin S-methyltransferase subunit G
MEARMAAVEKRLDRVEVRLDSIDERLRSVESTLANVSGKIDILASNMSQMLGKLPSWWQMPVVVAGTAALVIAIIKLFASN